MLDLKSSNVIQHFVEGMVSSCGINYHRYVYLSLLGIRWMSMLARATNPSFLEYILAFSREAVCLCPLQFQLEQLSLLLLLFMSMAENYTRTPKCLFADRILEFDHEHLKQDSLSSFWLPDDGSMLAFVPR